LIRIPLAIYLDSVLMFGDLEKALWVALIAGLSDKLDGTLARRFGVGVSPLGRALDPVAERIFVIIVFYTLIQTILSNVLLINC